MVPKNLIAFFLLIGIFASAGMAQNTYSESSAYKPRESNKPEKDRKKKSDDKNQTVIQPTANADGDVTVTIPVAVLDRSGSAIGGLTRQDVSVFIDDIEVPIAAFEQDKEPLNVILIMDSSPSAALRFEKMQEQARKFVKALPTNTKVMVVDFNIEMNVRSQPTVNRADSLSAISKIKIGDGTSIYSALHFLYEKLLPQIPGRKVIVLMTDGVDTTSKKSTFAKSLTEVEKEDVTIYPIYFDTFQDRSRALNRQNDWIAQILQNSNMHMTGSSSSDAEYKRGLLYLQDLASASGGRLFSSEKLEDGTKSLLGELANRYYVTVTIPRKNSGSHAVRVRVNRPSVAVFARGSFVEK